MAEYDVLVVGSGAAGLSAALPAAVAGARVAVLEASRLWGGTTAVSGGQVWIPGNPHMAGAGVDDSFADALAYCIELSPGRDPRLITAFVEAGPRMVEFVEAHSELRLKTCDWPDTFAEHPAGRSTARHLEPAPLKLRDDEDPAALWPHPYPPVLTNDDVFGSGLYVDFSRFPAETAQRRSDDREVTMGVALVLGLLRACRDAGVALYPETRVTRIRRDDGGRVSGVDTADGSFDARAVVLAAGGFEWDTDLVVAHLAGPLAYPASPPVNRGDGLRLAAAAGAQLARLGESWAWPVTVSAGATWGGDPQSPRASLVMSERTLPHVIWVNAAGQRFVNESSHNCALAFAEVDPGGHRLRNQPAWAVGDAQFRARYPVGGIPPGAPAPDWLAQGDTLADVAKVAGIDPDGLAATVQRFNEFVAGGVDRDFHRGESAYDRRLGDFRTPHPSLGSIEQPPFFALPIHAGAVGTKGGARTDERARVLDWAGEPIPGLYAAGNTMAATFGPGTIAAGLTLGCAMTWGWIAGTDAAKGAAGGAELTS